MLLKLIVVSSTIWIKASNKLSNDEVVNKSRLSSSWRYTRTATYRLTPQITYSNALIASLRAMQVNACVTPIDRLY